MSTYIWLEKRAVQTTQEQRGHVMSLIFLIVVVKVEEVRFLMKPERVLSRYEVVFSGLIHYSRKE